MKLDLDQVLAADGADALRQVVDHLRSGAGSGKGSPTARLQALVDGLRGDASRVSRFRQVVRETLAGTRLVHVLVGAGIVSDKGIGAQLRRRLGSLLLPRVYPRDDLRSLVPKIFTEADDWEWVAAISPAIWASLFDLAVDDDDVVGFPHRDIATAVRALAQRIGALGIDDELSARCAAVESDESPFLELPVAAYQFLEDHREHAGSLASTRRVLAISTACGLIVEQVRASKGQFGTSLHLTSLTRRLLQQLERFDLLVNLIHPRDTSSLARSLAPLFVSLLESIQTGERLGRAIRDNADLVAYQITEHTATKGEKYISGSASSYRNYLLAAMVGGAIVAVFAVFKLFLAKLSLPLAVEALVYGANYSACFVLIYLTGAVLATKQPAMTASAIARRIDEAPDHGDAFERVADAVVVVWRTQFASFVGNIAMAFPIAILIAMVLEGAFAVETVTPEKAEALLAANHPWASAALLYAAIAGVCLFLSGIIQGAVDNRVVYTRLRDRLSNHPRLAFLGRRRQRFVGFVVKHAGGIASNTALGFMLGSAGTIGIILGLPIDIRHIAFSSSHVGVAALDAPAILGPYLLVVSLGVIGIGLVNFLTSFGLTMVLTLESRRVTAVQGRALARALARRMIRSPLSWFIPVRRRTPRS